MLWLFRKFSAWLELKLWLQGKVYFERAFPFQLLPLKTKLKGEKLYDMNQPTRGLGAICQTNWFI